MRWESYYHYTIFFGICHYIDMFMVGVIIDQEQHLFSEVEYVCSLKCTNHFRKSSPVIQPKSCISPFVPFVGNTLCGFCTIVSTDSSTFQILVLKILRFSIVSHRILKVYRPDVYSRLVLCQMKLPQVASMTYLGVSYETHTISTLSFLCLCRTCVQSRTFRQAEMLAYELRRIFL